MQSIIVELENLAKFQDLFLVDDVGQVIELLILHFIFSNETPKEFVNALIQMTSDLKEWKDTNGEVHSSIGIVGKLTPKLKCNPFGSVPS